MRAHRLLGGMVVFVIMLGAAAAGADAVPPIRPEQMPATATSPARAIEGKHADPNGATALCKDGSYSHSHHRSRTCGKHGGVAKWLDESGK